MKKNCFLLLFVAFWQLSNAQLTIYAGLNSQGISATCVNRTIYKGVNIPSGLNNSIKSISLSQGFMATLAENEDGTGERFTYMAVQSAINVNLSFVMQNKISFIRVLKLPAVPVRKKGAGEVDNSKIPSLNVTWFYDWGIRDKSTPTREFVPMAWSGAGHATPPLIDSVLLKDSTTHYLAFNEPDHAGQAEMWVNESLPYYKNMQRAGYRMGSPSCTESQFRVWLDSFSKEAAKQKLQIDYVGVHWYDWGNWLSTNNANPNPVDVFNRFKSYIDQVWNLYKKPIWITEFNANTNRPASVHEGFMNLVLPWMDADPRIERYAYFFGNDCYSHDPVTGVITTAGLIYANNNSALANPNNIVDTRPVYPETILAAWNTSALTTTQSHSNTNPFTPTTINANIIVNTPLTAGSGVASFGGGAAGYWGGTSWSNTTTTQGITDNKFYSFKLQSTIGKTVNYSLIDSIHIRVNTNGPDQFLLQYQINNGSFVNITTLSIPTVTTLTFATLNSVNLSNIVALQNVPTTSTVTFRLVPFGATTTNSFAIGNGTTETDNDFGIIGSFVEDSSTLITTPGNALNFDGTNDYVTVPDANSLDLVSNYTLEAWIRPTSFSSSAGIISKSQTNTSAGYFLSLSNTAPFTGLNFDGLQTTNGILETGKWYHIAAVKNGSTRTLYVNGVATTLTGAAITTAANTQALTIGVHNLQTPVYFAGSIDDVRIWNTARLQTELAEFMFNTISPTTNNLVEYYNFDVGVAAATNTGISILQDQTGNVNNGTLTGFALAGSTSNWVESYAMVIPNIATATNKATTSFTANWSAPAIASLSTINNYLLDVSTNPNFSSFVAGYNGLSVSSTSQIVSGIAPNTTHYYRVRANKTSINNQGGFSQTTMVSALSNNADLTNLTINTGSLSPSFASVTLLYSVTYTNIVSNVAVMPTASNNFATIQVNINGGSYTTVNSGFSSASLALNVGVNNINILVTAEDLVTTKLYVITATREVNTWTGASTSNYNTASNWTGNVVPTIDDDVLIPNVASASNRFPQITGANHPQNLSFAKNITIENGATLTLSNAPDFSTYGQFRIAGTITNNGTFTVSSLANNGPTIEFVGTTPQTIAANTFVSNSVFNLIINNATGVTLNGALTINGRLVPTLGTFTTNNNVTLSSISTRTAAVAAGSGSITGNVTVQRFIPGGRRAFRLLAHPFSNNLTINSLTDDIDITGAGGSPFTITSTNSPSAFWYNNTTANSSLSTDPGWAALTASSTLNAKTGYRVLIRGSKGQSGSLTGGSYTPAAVTIDWSGTLNQGTQIFTLANANANAQYNLIGNPYASPVDLSLTSRGSNINANFSVWNPNILPRGGYETQPFTTPYILPSGAAFFARTTATTNNTITFDEADKATTAPTSIFRTNKAEDKMVLELTDNNNNYADQLAFYFDEKNKNYTANNDVLWDAEKLTNPDANLYSFSKDGKKLAIDRRPLVDSSIIPLGLTNTTSANFTLTVKELPTINANYNFYLNDKWLNTQTLLQQNTNINIAITSNTASQGNNRFEIVSKPKPVLPVVTTNNFTVKLSPNPAKDIVTINFSNVEAANTTITFVNGAGKTVKTMQAGNVQTGIQRINVQNLAKGVYYVTLNNGTDIKTEKLVKQ